MVKYDVCQPTWEPVLNEIWYGINSKQCDDWDAELGDGEADVWEAGPLGEA